MKYKSTIEKIKYGETLLTLEGIFDIDELEDLVREAKKIRGDVDCISGTWKKT